MSESYIAHTTASIANLSALYYYGMVLFVAFLGRQLALHSVRDLTHFLQCFRRSLQCSDTAVVLREAPYRVIQARVSGGSLVCICAVLQEGAVTSERQTGRYGVSEIFSKVVVLPASEFGLWIHALSQVLCVARGLYATA